MPRTKDPNKPKMVRLNIKCPEKEAKQIRKNAEEHAFGNMSDWIRTAALKYIPK